MIRTDGKRTIAHARASGVEFPLSVKHPKQLAKLAKLVLTPSREEDE